MGLLGCGVTQAFIQTRGGGTIVGVVPFTGDLTYQRRVDEMTSARCTVGVEGFANEACCAMLGDLNAWEHELSVVRNGVEVWCGPVLEPEWTTDLVTIDARDLFQWFERRVLPEDRDFMNTDLATIFATYASDALGQDTSPNIFVATAPTGVKGTRAIFGAQRRRAADEMREIARSGLDFTMIGRTMRCGGEEVPTTALATLTNDTLRGARVRQRGSETATQVSVIGTRLSTTSEPSDQVVGIFGGPEGDLGLVELTFNEDGILDTRSAIEAAASHWHMLHHSPHYVTGRLDPEAPIDFDDLVPGARIELDLVVGCKLLSGPYRLATVDGIAHAAEDNADEEVNVTFIPLGATDAGGA